MKSRRQYIRINSHSKCIITSSDGSVFSAMLDNISLGGALVRMHEAVPLSLNVGDECSLTPALCPVKFACRIVRIHHTDAGVSFLNHIPTEAISSHFSFKTLQSC